MNCWQSRDNIQKFFIITEIIILTISSIIAFNIESEFNWILIIFNVYVFLVLLHNELNNKQVIYEN